MDDFPELHLLWDYNAPEETAVRFHELLPRVAASDNRAYHVALLSQIARTYSLRRQFDKAHELLDAAEGLLTDEMVVPRIRYLLERGRAFNSAGKAAKGLVLFHEAFELGTGTVHQADFHTVDAAHMIAIAEPKPLDQLQWNEAALELAEASDDKRAQGWRGSLYNNLGWTYHDMDQYEKALTIFEKALLWHEANSQNQLERIRIAKWCVGRTLRSLNRLPEALALQQALLDEYKMLGQPSGYTYEELGECLLSLGRVEESRSYFAQAYAELSQIEWLVEAEPARLERLRELGASEK